MNIGQLATLAGVSADTLRFYEKEGLLEAPERGENGYRRYREADVTVVRYIRAAQGLGFSLAEIRWILPRFADGRVSRAEIRRHMDAKLKQIDERIAEMRALRRELIATARTLDCLPESQVPLEKAKPKTAVAAKAVAAKKGAAAPALKSAPSVPRRSGSRARA